MGGATPAPPEGFVEADRLQRAAEQLPETVAIQLAGFALDAALDEIWAFVTNASRYIARKRLGGFVEPAAPLIAKQL